MLPLDRTYYLNAEEIYRRLGIRPEALAELKEKLHVIKDTGEELFYIEEVKELKKRLGKIAHSARMVR